MAQGGHERSADVGSRFAGYQVYDRHYEKVGKVDDLFVDENDRPEYIGVKTGFFGGRSTLIPMEITRVNDERRLVEVNSEIDIIKDSPAIDDDEEVTPEFEGRVYAHFGLTREGPSAGRGGYYGVDSSGVDTEYGERARFYDLPIDAEDTAPGRESARRDMAGDRESGEPRRQRDEAHSPLGGDEERGDRERGEVGPGTRTSDTESGEFRGHGREQEGVRQPGSDPEDPNELRVQRSEEELRVGTRERQAGSVNVRKSVRTDRERMSVPKRREEVTVERAPVEGREASEAEIGDDEIRMPVVEEEVVVEKRPVIKEELRIRKDVVEDQEVVEEDLRKEEVDVYDETTRREDTGGGTERRDR